MNKLLVLCSFFLGMNGTIQQDEKKECSSYDIGKENNHVMAINDSFLTYASFAINAENHEHSGFNFSKIGKEKEFDLASIIYIEEETELDLGFDTKKYLPRGFNPYGFYFNIHSINYVENEVQVEFAFDTKQYLPENFNPYTALFDMNAINYIEEEAPIELGFDTKQYLPKDFNAYAKPSML
jgi:hypothetical protein